MFWLVTFPRDTANLLLSYLRIVTSSPSFQILSIMLPLTKPVMVSLSKKDGQTVPKSTDKVGRSITVTFVAATEPPAMAGQEPESGSGAGGSAPVGQTPVFL